MPIVCHLTERRPLAAVVMSKMSPREVSTFMDAE
jgi:hypothetical protein